MSKFNSIQTDFTGGEISLKCIGRVDINRYAHAAELLRNFTISPQGGAIRRSGTRYVAAVPDSSNFTRLLEFRFSTLDSCVIELSNNLIRFYANQGLVLSGMSAYSIVSPYSSADLPLIKVTQSADIIYLFHPAYSTQVLSRFGATNWTIAPIVLLDGPYLDFNFIDGITKATTGTVVTPSVLTGAGILTASNPIFAATDVGRIFRIYNSGISSSNNMGWCTITGFTSTTVVSITVGDGSTMPTGINFPTWQFGAFGGTLGYPSCGTFFQQRLTMGNTPGQPQTFFMSQSGDFYNFAPTLVDTTVTDACAIVYTIASNEVNSILWFSPSAILMVGTDGAEWEVSSNSYNATPVTPTNIDVALQTRNGSQPTSRPLRVGWETVFVARSGRDVLKLVYEFQINGFQSKSLSLLGEHIAREGNQLIDMAYQQFPHSILWLPRQRDGRLAGLTYLAEQDVVGWHLHTIGGTFSGSNAVVESVAVIPTPDGTKDQLWMVVKRTIGGNQVRYVEYMEVPFDSSDTPTTEMCFVDSASTYSGSPATVISGLNYLIGETVSILADGSVVDDQIVSNSGTITLRVAASTVVVGYGYESLMKVLRLEGGGSAGTGQGKLKRINKVIVRYFETLGIEWSVDGETWNEVSFRQQQDVMGQAPPLFTGDMAINIDGQVDFAGQYWLRQTQPYPSTILALMPEAMVNQ